MGHMNKYTHQNSEFLNHNYVVKSSTVTKETDTEGHGEQGGDNTENPEATRTHANGKGAHEHGAHGAHKIEKRHLQRKREIVKINSIPKQGILGIAFALQHCKSVDIYGFGNMKEDGSSIDHAHYYDLT